MVMWLKCPKCGAVVDEYEKKCNKCGDLEAAKKLQEKKDKKRG